MPRSRQGSSPAPPPPESLKKGRASGRSFHEFEPLSSAEKKLVDCCRRGVEATIAKRRPKQETDANRVRASLIRFLAMGGDDDAPVHEYGVALVGAWIGDALNLEDAVLQRALSLQNCWIRKVSAWRASVPTLMLSGSYLEEGMDAGVMRSSFGLAVAKVKSAGPITLFGARMSGDFFANGLQIDVPEDIDVSLNLGLAVIDGRVMLNGARANASVSLDNSVVKGDLECVSARFNSPTGFGLTCDGAEFGQNAYLRDGFRAVGGVRMIGAKVGLTLDCSNASFKGGPEGALECERAKVAGPVFLLNSRFSGQANFHNATIAGTLICHHTKLRSSTVVALDCSSSSIGSVELAGKFSANGQISFVGSEIKGRLLCRGVRLNYPAAIALNLDDASVAHSVIVCAEAHVSGAITLRGAKIGRNFECMQSKLDRPAYESGSVFSSVLEATDAQSLSLSRSHVAGSVIIGSQVAVEGTVDLSGAHVTGMLHCEGEFASLLCSRAVFSGNVQIGFGFTAMEEVIFAGSRIAGDFNCERGKFQNPARAITCDNIEISGNALLSNIHSMGTVNFDNATIEKSLICVKGVFEDHVISLSLEFANIGRTFTFRESQIVNGGLVSLISAQVGELDDDLQSWSGARGRLFLDGFKYDRITSGSPIDPADRAAWLTHQYPAHLGEEFRPQPWEQLIAALRSSGHPISARETAIARNDQLRRAGKIISGARGLHWLYGKLVGYGYKPVRLLWTIVAVWLLCAGTYWAATLWPREGDAVLTSMDPKSEKKLESTESFSPLFYSADVLLPIVDLGYSETWRPAVNSTDKRIRDWARLLRIVRWLEIVLGWLFGGALAAMLTHLVKKE